MRLNQKKTSTLTTTQIKPLKPIHLIIDKHTNEPITKLPIPSAYQAAGHPTEAKKP